MWVGEQPSAWNPFLTILSWHAVHEAGCTDSRKWQSTRPVGGAMPIWKLTIREVNEVTVDAPDADGR